MSESDGSSSDREVEKLVVASRHSHGYGHGRSREEEEDEQEGEEAGSSGDDEEANADLSLGIIAKAKSKSKSKSIATDEGDQKNQRSSCGDDENHGNPSNGGKLNPNNGYPNPNPNPSDENPSLNPALKPAPSPGHEEPSSPNPGTESSKGKKWKKKKKMKKSKETLKNEKDSQTRKEGKTLFKEITEAEEDNLVMRKLLRGPRYFDEPEEKVCFRCGNTGHLETSCTEEPRKKRCYTCGEFGHDAKNCSQVTCYVCKGVGHIGKNCPRKHDVFANKDQTALKFCILCGDAGHEYSACQNDYDPEDLKGIQCYFCKGFGHLCCVDLLDNSAREISCYNCGQTGHAGVGCAGGKSEEKKRKVCYKCGEEGHFARGCIKQDEDNWWPSPHTPHHKNQGGGSGESDFLGFRSVPINRSRHTRFAEGEAAEDGNRDRRGWKFEKHNRGKWNTPCEDEDDGEEEGEEGTRRFKNNGSYRKRQKRRNGDDEDEPERSHSGGRRQGYRRNWSKWKQGKQESGRKGSRT